MRKILLFLVICVGIPFLLLKCMGTAHSKQSLTVSNAFANPTMGDLKVGAVFLDIKNDSILPNAVVAVETPIAARAELHEHTHENGVMRMREIKALELLPGQLVKLEPGGYHIMLFDLKKPLKLREKFMLTLKMRSGLKMNVPVRVEERD